MQRNNKAILSLAAMMNVLFCSEMVIDPPMCAEVVANSTIHQIGYNSINSTLSISFLNSLSHCTSEVPYQTNRLDISLLNFDCTYLNKKTTEPETYSLPQGCSKLFAGEIACYDTCEIILPVELYNVSIKYVRKATEMSCAIVIAVDTNAVLAGEFKIWDYE